MSDSTALPPVYSRSLLLTLALLLGLCLGINLLVDPLWHFSGNRLTGLNMGFNERLSKLNLAARVASNKDCAIYGSSRATLLDASLIEPFDCFNMAVSEGLALEFPLYAHYLARQGLEAKLVIIGADDLSFFSPVGRNNAPAFLQRGEARPSWWQDYLSLDALQFSLRGLAGKSPRPRFYQADFSIAIESGRRVYRPSPESLTLRPAEQADARQARRPSPEYLQHYRKLLEQHPEAELRIYIPPISVWRLGDMIRRGEMADYLASVYALRDLGAPVLDFSVASALTADPSLTYDGSHYNLKVNQRVASALMSGRCEYCLPVHELTQAEYEDQFLAAYRLQREILLP